jgi:hypothetical protein
LEAVTGVQTCALPIYQVTFANAEHYIYDGYKVHTFKVEGKYALYVSDQKIKRDKR